MKDVLFFRKVVNDADTGTIELGFENSKNVQSCFFVKFMHNIEKDSHF